MDFSNKHSILIDLHHKHGHEPLIQLLRKLILSIDKSEYGSEEHQQTLELLQLVSGQDIGDNASLWLDWVENEDPEVLSWDYVLDKNQPVSLSGRKVIEIQEEQSSFTQNSVDTPILSKEQELWQKAIHQSQNRGSFNTTHLLLFCVILCIGLSVYFYINDSSVRNDVFQKSQVHLLNFWGSYHQLIPNETPFYRNHFDHMNKDFMLSLPVDQMEFEQQNWIKNIVKQKILPLNWQKKALWAYIWQSETSFSSGQLPQIRSLFDIDGIGLGKNVYQWKRHSNEGLILKGKFEESIKMVKNRFDWNIKRMSGKDGSAHRFIIDKQGLVVWVWKLIYKGHVFQGKIKRLSDRVYQNQYTGFGWKTQSSQIKVPVNTACVPAIWSPRLIKLNAKVALFPISGQAIATDLFYSDLLVEDLNEDQFSLYSQLADWTEAWILTTSF